MYIVLSMIKNMMSTVDTKMTSQPPQPEFVGKGSYGCVVMNAPLCDEQDKKLKNVNYVTKVFNNKTEYDKEKNNFQIAKSKIDPYNHSIVELYQKCDIPQEYVSLLNRVCKNNSSKNYMHKLILEYGGDDLLKQLNKGNPFKNLKEFFIAMHPLFWGLNLLYRAKYIHGDIKLNNITYNRSTKEMKFIDLSLLREMSYMKSTLQSKNYNEKKYLFPTYKLYPSELRFFINKPLSPNYNGLYSVQKIKGVKAALKKIDEDLSNKFKNNQEQILHNAIERLDAYSLGEVMLEVYKYMIEAGVPDDYHPYLRLATEMMTNTTYNGEKAYNDYRQKYLECQGLATLEDMVKSNSIIFANILAGFKSLITDIKNGKYERCYNINPSNILIDKQYNFTIDIFLSSSIDTSSLYAPPEIMTLLEIPIDPKNNFAKFVDKHKLLHMPYCDATLSTSRTFQEWYHKQMRTLENTTISDLKKCQIYSLCACLYECYLKLDGKYNEGLMNLVFKALTLSIEERVNISQAIELLNSIKINNKNTPKNAAPL